MAAALPRTVRRSWLVFTYEATFQLDPAGPTWDERVLRDVRLPRWSYDIHDKGWAVFLRTEQKLSEGPTFAKLRLLPERPRPQVQLEVHVEGRWSDDDERRTPSPGLADIREEAEALLVLLGCRSPRLRFGGAERRR